MRKGEIQVGRTYAGRSGLCRRVTGERAATFTNQEDCDVVHYVFVASGDGYAPPQERECTRAAFASWARWEVA